MDEKSGVNTISSQIINAKAFKELDALPVDLKVRASKYFVNKNKVDQLGYWGSMVQEIIYLAALAFNPAFLILGRIESLHMFYSVVKLAAGPSLYYYDPQKNASVIYKRDLCGESVIFGKSVDLTRDGMVAWRGLD